MNTYVCRFHCTAGELADASDLTQASLSRYRNEQRVLETDTLKKLAAGIVSIAEQNEYTGLDFDLVFSELAEAVGIVETDHTQFSGQFSVAEIRRIRKIEQICKQINCSAENDSLSLADFTTTVTQYLCISKPKERTEKNIGDYLKKLDEFDLNEYVTLIRFDQLKVPTVPFHLSSSRNYYGMEQMKQGELDFFKATALSRSKEPIFMNSDMPMADMTQDMEFNKKWMFGILSCRKKGLHLHMIHHVD